MSGMTEAEAARAGGKMDYAFLENELKHFLDAGGKLIKYPSKYKLKVYALYYLASKLEHGKRYTEKEINSVLREWHTFDDWALLRRDLYDKRFLDRESNGSFYWLEETQPTLESLKLT